MYYTLVHLAKSERFNRIFLTFWTSDDTSYLRYFNTCHTINLDRIKDLLDASQSFAI